MLLSIAIPAYNRPVELSKLLASLPNDASFDFEVIIAEDFSPRRSEIRDVVAQHTANSAFPVRYIENDENVGYDRNLRVLCEASRADFVMFMGDDDRVISKNFAAFLSFLRRHKDCGYVLRRYSIARPGGELEDFRYYDGHRYFEPGPGSVAELFRKSVFISGFCFNREVFAGRHVDVLDGSLLYQLYIMGVVVNDKGAVYCDIPIAMQIDEERGVPEFGSAKSERGLYTPGTVSIENSLRFMSGFPDVLEVLESAGVAPIKARALKDMARYCYPVLAIQRGRGIRKFILYVVKVGCLMNYYKSVYYWLYACALILLGRGACDRLILSIKRRCGSTPRL